MSRTSDGDGSNTKDPTNIAVQDMFSAQNGRIRDDLLEKQRRKDNAAIARGLRGTRKPREYKGRRRILNAGLANGKLLFLPTRKSTSAAG